MKIWAHLLVCNEERYVWYAVMSVIDHVDKVLLWDTGSTDKTIRIIKEIKRLRKDKVELNLLGKVTPEEFTNVRQEMLNQTKSGWLIIVDGDEVWWDNAITKLTEIIRAHGDKMESVVSRYYNVVGDIFHYQEEAAGQYKIDGKVGHLTVRAINRKISGLCVLKPHGIQGFYDSSGNLIQQRGAKKRLHLDSVAYLHFTNMARSSADELVPKRALKLKYELGHLFPLDFYYPEVFFRSRPKIVPNPWIKMDRRFFIKSLVLTIPRKIKRRLIKGSTGY